ncbi:MAPEG family protein [Rhodobacteraceae bacterium SC52]|nr:MAPEG family protein [Rhodobacteraceae bacterium SC52]
MTPELTALALSALLVLIQLGWMAVRANVELGSGYFLSPRDTPMPKKPSDGTMRLERAYKNHLEAFLPFAAAVAVVTLAHAESAFTVTCAFTYLAARVLYVPAYRFGWVPWRSVFFGLAYVATIAMLVAALLSKSPLS